MYINTSEKKIRKPQRKLDRQRRANNPNNYDEKGLVKKAAKATAIVSNG
jgi:hypothetical protein